MNLRRLELLLLSPLSWLLLFCHFYYQFYHLFISSTIGKLLKMTWYIIDRKADKFRMSGVDFDFAIARFCYRSLCLCLCLDDSLFCLCLLYLCLCLGCLLFCLRLLTMPILGLAAFLILPAMFVPMLDLLALLSMSIMSMAMPGLSALLSLSPVCACAWIVSFSVCICYLYLCLGRWLFHLRLLYL